MRKNKIAVCLAGTLFITNTTFADFSCDVDYFNERVVINGQTNTKEEEVSVQVQKSTNREVLYNDQCPVTDGEYEIPFRYDVTDVSMYEVKIRESGTDEMFSEKIRLVPKTLYEEAIEKINEASQSSDGSFAEIFNRYENVFNIDEELKKSTSFDKAIEELAAELKKNRLNIENNRLNDKVVNTVVIFNSVKSSEINNVIEYLDYLQLDEDFEDYLLKVCTNSEKSKYFTSKLKNTVTAEYNKSDKALYEALILTMARYANIGAFKEVVQMYGEKAGIGVSGIKSYAYSVVSGKDYNSILELDKALKNAKSPESGGSGGGSGGGGSSGSNKNTGSGMTVSGVTNSQIPQLRVRFIDLNTVEWAYEAIMVLADEGIINGKTATEFYPNDRVTREEFVKMLVCTANLDGRDYSKGYFSDVDENAWYAKYVNIAYENGICNGIGEGKFGTGKRITRQDMAVMVYNFMKLNDANDNVLHTEFDDDAQISDYAKTAVASLSEMGIINGVGDNKFAPKDDATRAQAAVIIYAGYQKMRG